MRNPSRPAVAALALLSLGVMMTGPAAARTARADPAPDPLASIEATLSEPAPDPSVEATLSEPAADPTIQIDADPGELPSIAVTELSDWVIASGDNKGMPFLIVDKPDAEVLVYDADGVMVGSAPALLGIARGDDTAPGVGDEALSKIPMDERTTAAGRFVAHLGPSSDLGEVLWVDYDSGLSLHAVITSNPKERRLQRLHSSSIDERRISHGCINVPAAFYKDVVDKTFAGAGGVVYILPDTKRLDVVFPSLGPADAQVALGPN
jgi:hypothetical protein